MSDDKKPEQPPEPSTIDMIKQLALAHDELEQRLFDLEQKYEKLSFGLSHHQHNKMGAAMFPVNNE